MKETGQLMHLEGEYDIERDVKENLPNELVELPEEDFTSEVNNLLEWTDNLDYDKYCSDW
eukprot:CAMPEP_0116912880 /NCGR_PEP_ID=MMETSP0467-20121206/16364_1 /TAXON_ID=283647 /ORGANISM="Mesodinium pulex, Strain SPMC105" /LENGTH=59 /DNA_ID=CAMNT_0004588973 /DNA_START=994 /DNA_END=1170 /DNA_ORIENTATION=+